jgi:hypothetical protein
MSGLSAMQVVGWTSTFRLRRRGVVTAVVCANMDIVALNKWRDEVGNFMGESHARLRYRRRRRPLVSFPSLEALPRCVGSSLKLTWCW